MTQRTWVILGATSIIAEKFAHIAAQAGHRLRLIGRQSEQLNLIAQDIQLRYKVPCEFFVVDMTAPETLPTVLNNNAQELDLFIAHGDFTENDHLNPHSIQQLIQVNIQATTLLINAYLNRTQKQHHLLYLSSVAACRGRAKNSLYGATKACIEVYLHGLQQGASSSQQITIARLGFIDTRQTYGQPGIFYAGPPTACAQACWNALRRKKRLIYYPFFWRGIMAIISRVPFFVYKRMSSV